MATLASAARVPHPATARTYLVSHSLGAMPRAARPRSSRPTPSSGPRAACAPGPRAGGTCRVTVGDAVGRIIGAPAGSVVMHQNVSVCQSVILSCFDLGRPAQQDRLRGPELPLRRCTSTRRTATLGARVEIVPSDDGITVPLERFLAAIDETTLLVPLSHVIFKSGFVQDVAAIVRRAHEVGALRGGRPVPVRGHGAGGRHGLGRRLRDRRLGEVAVRRPGRGLPVRGAAAAATARAAGHRLDGARAPVRVRDRARSTTRADATRFLHGTPAVPALYAARAGYDDRRAASASDAIRAQVGAPDAAAHRPRARARLHAAHARPSPSARGHGHPRRAPRRGGHARAAAPRGARRPSPRRRHPLLAALLHDRRRDRPRGRPRPAGSSTPGAYRAHEAAGGTGF